MTLIMGLNFSHKLYLAGDTRVTRTEPGKEPISIDNIAKIVPIWGKQILGQAFYDKNTIALAVAGDLHFASFIKEKVTNALNKKELNSNIRVFSTQIKEYLRTATDEWLLDHEYSNCALIFAGMNLRARKKISQEKLDELLAQHEQQREKDKPSRDRFIKEVLPTNPTWQAMEAKLLQQRGKGVEEMIKEGDIPKISPWIQKAIDEKTNEIDMPDSLIIGIEIKPHQGIFNQQEAEWGEFIAYGAGLTKNDLNQSMMAVLEFSHIKEEDNPRLLEGAILTSEILDTAKNKKIGSIGGTVLLYSLEMDGQMRISGKDVKFNNPGEPISLKLMGQDVPLIMFHQYPKIPKGPETMEM
ncbi:MAG: hypothetical protein JWO00_288 [Candidatus Parcubacteria bacterium]|nr:hypothetical protein [Candidatus Parcubacteria bacterium]